MKVCWNEIIICKFKFD